MSNQPFEEQGLVLGDRINWAFVLAKAVITLHDALCKVEGEQSEQQVREASLAVYNSIPTSWVSSDQKFADDLKNCFDVIKIDDRKEWCGRKVGKPKIRKEDKLNPWRLYHACVDVFDRRNLLNKPIFTEIMTGRKFKNNGEKHGR
jgi:hypothetical protein